MRHSQQGASFFGWLAVIALIVFGMIIAMKLTPIYMDHYSLRNIITTVNEDPTIKINSLRDLNSYIDKGMQLNGIRDIDRHLGRDYWRVRIGVGRPEQVIPESRIDIRKWLLMDFMAQERDGWLQTLLRAMADEAERLVAQDEGGFMSRVAYLAPAPKPPRAEDTENEETS